MIEVNEDVESIWYACGRSPVATHTLSLHIGAVSYNSKYTECVTIMLTLMNPYYTWTKTVEYICYLANILSYFLA